MSPDLRLDDSPLTRRTVRAGSRLCNRAFNEDPFFRFLLPDDTLRTRGVTLLHRVALAHLGPHSRAVLAYDGHDLVGLAAWFAPGGHPQRPLDQLAQVPGALRAFYRRPRALADGNAYTVALAKVRDPGPHWYLHLLAVEPDRQRGGVGSALLADGLARVDADHLPCSLATQNDDNLAYYRRFGFELRDTLTPVSDGPALYTMHREPRP